MEAWIFLVAVERTGICKGEPIKMKAGTLSNIVKGSLCLIYMMSLYIIGTIFL